MGNSKIDTIIQHKLLGHRTGLNKESLWAAIEGDVVTSTATTLPTNKTDNSLLRILPFLLLAAAVGLSSMYLLTNDEAADAKSPATLQTQIATSNVTSNENPQSKNDNATIAPAILDKTEVTNTLADLDKQPTQLKSKIAQAQAAINQNKIQPTTKQQEINSQAKQQTFRPSTIAETVFTANNSDITPSVQFSSIISKQSTVGVDNNVNSSKTDIITPLSNNVLQPFNYDTPSVAITEDYMSPFKDKISCYSYGPSKLKISGLLYYGPGGSLRSLKTNDEEMNTLVEERKNSEVVLENHRAGLQLKATTNSGIYFKAGLERSIINEKFQQFSTDTTMEIRQVIVEIIEYPDGSTDEVYGDQLVTIISRKEWKKYNQFKTFDLTAIVGYERTIKKWKYAVEGGVIYNFNTEFDGTILNDVSLQPTGDTDQLFKTQTGIDLHLAGGLGFDILPSMTLWAMPSIRFDLNNINQASYNVDQSYQMANLLLGLEYRF